MQAPSLTCEWFVKDLRMICERLVKPQLKKSNFANPYFNLWNFRKSLLTWENSPCVNLGYFHVVSIRFLFQDILCNFIFSPYNQLKIFSDIIISWRSFVFRFLGYFSEGLKISLYICLRISPSRYLELSKEVLRDHLYILISK